MSSAVIDQESLRDPSQRLLDAIRYAVARRQTQDTADRTSERVRAGATVRQIPLGYRAVRNGSGRRIEVDLDRAQLVSWAFEAFASGEHELPGLLRALTAKGLTTAGGPRTPPRSLTTAALVRLLRNPYYLGVVSYRGVRYNGRHDALVDRVTFERVQRRIAAESGPARHYLDAAVTCGRCQSLLRVRRHRRGPYAPELVCPQTSCDHQAIGVEVMEGLVAEHYRDVTLAPELRPEVGEALGDENLDLYRAYQDASPALRREFNQSLFTRLWIGDDGQLHSAPVQPPVAVVPATSRTVDRDAAALAPSPQAVSRRRKRVSVPPTISAPPDRASERLPAPLAVWRLRMPSPMVLGSAVIVAWGVMILASSILQPSVQTQRVALFFHLAALVLGFGAVLFVDWHGLLFLARRRTQRDVVSIVCAAHPLIWSGLAVLVGSGIFLRPNLTSVLTWTKLALVFTLAVNGLVAAQISRRLRELGDRLPTARLLVLGGIVAVVSQLSWWGSTLIGYVTATS